jgi:hypothetical protein
MTLQELVQAASEGQLEEVLEKRSGEITPELASEARALFKESLGAGNLPLAQLAAYIAARAWLAVGDRKQAIVNRIDVNQVEYLQAETPESYSSAREGLLQARAFAEEIGARDEAFKAATIAADCSYWAAQASAAAAHDDLLLQALADIVAASEVADAAPGVEFERFVSLLTAAVSDAMGTVWLDDREARAEDLLRQVAAVADRSVPADFAYQEAGDAQKTAETTQVIVALADAYGA